LNKTPSHSGRHATENPNAAQIRERLDSWANAVRAKDVEAVMSHYAPDILSFDLAPPLKYSGADACQKNWAAWFPTFQGPVDYESSELSIVSCHDVAYCHSLNRIRGTRTDGEQTDVWVRATVGFRNIDGRWMIAHEHYSVPFYMEPPYKASLDLKPEEI
jgi:ketosteroid isomerase-like protein